MLIKEETSINKKIHVLTPFVWGKSPSCFVIGLLHWVHRLKSLKNSYRSRSNSWSSYRIGIWPKESWVGWVVDGWECGWIYFWKDQEFVGIEIWMGGCIDVGEIVGDGYMQESLEKNFKWNELFLVQLFSTIFQVKKNLMKEINTKLIIVMQIVKEVNQ